MVTNDRRELKVARRLIKKHRLSPPVDIHKLAQAYSQVIHVRPPAQADAFLLYPDEDHPEHLILLNRDYGIKRQRFTLAHELAHIVLPWHIGELEYSLSNSNPLNTEYAEREREADRFASELLMPTAWLTNLVSQYDKIIPTTIAKQVANSARVSLYAASSAVSQVIPPNMALVVVDSMSNVVHYRGTSPGFRFSLPDWHSDFNDYNFEFVSNQWRDTNGTHDFHWFQFKVPKQKGVQRLNRNSSDILNDILSQVCGDHDKLKSKLVPVISGTFGAGVPADATEYSDALFEKIVVRLKGKAALHEFCSHRLFQPFVLTKLHEILERRRS